jgi:SAM-dependent methyltransferase
MNSPGRLPEGAAPAPAVVTALPQLADRLRAVGYSGDALRAVLGVDGGVSTAPGDLVVHERRLAAAPGPLADLIALFTLGWSRPVDAVAAAVGSNGVDALVASGCAVADGPSLRPMLRLVPHGRLWLASDRRHEPGTPADPLQVTGINPPATLLSVLTVRRPVARALDVGTGNGIQALLAAQHTGHVVATDVNPRALAFAAFNAALNGVDNIEFRHGSLLEPVAGEQFGLVVSNPPYVISPEHEFVFRDSGAAPGALCAELVRSLPAVLEPGGYASMLASWPIAADEHWSSVPRSWLGDDCRAWLLHVRAEDGLLHAQQWNRPLAESGDIAGYAAAIDRWLDYLGERGIATIGYGAVLVQQHSDERTVVRADEVRAGSGSAGAHIERVFAAHKALRDVDDDTLAEWTCAVPPEHVVDRSVRFVDGHWRSGETRLTLGEGVGVEATLDPLLTEVFLLATSGATVRAAAIDVGRSVGIAESEIEGLVAAAVAMVRELISFGIVVRG